jgi:RNA polymerase sigma-70 factor (ECF subfamily)
VTADPFNDALVAAMPRLRRFAQSLTRDPLTADDLSQDTLIRALSNRDKFLPGSNMIAWLTVICRNHFRSEGKRHWRMVELDDAANALVADHPIDPLIRLELDDVLAALSRLPAERRDAVLLVAEGESYEVAAGLLGVAVGTVKSRINRARTVLDVAFPFNEFGRRKSRHAEPVYA